MRKKGFNKPVKYIFLGGPNLTKTSLAMKTGLSYFESDGLKNPLDPLGWDLEKKILIIGGRHYDLAEKLLEMLLPRLKAYKVIVLFFVCAPEAWFLAMAK